jgi:hypothetical protein
MKFFTKIIFFASFIATISAVPQFYESQLEDNYSENHLLDGNNYDDIAERASSSCSEPMVVGPCRAAFARFYHSGGQCKPFTYGGCKGNGNNFASNSACEAACVKRDVGEYNDY